MTSASRKILLGFILMFFMQLVNAQISGDYQTKADGNWSSGTAVWQKYDGAAWNDEAVSPTNANGTITIKHAIVLDVNASVDQFVVDNGAVLSISSGKTLTIANGADATDATINGTIENGGTVTTAGVLAFSATGVYDHKYTTTRGTIPTATWDAASTCKVTGYTTAASGTPGGQAQVFGNFEWNCPLQQNNMSNNTSSCNGNFTITNTGTGKLKKTANLLINTASVFTVGANATYMDNDKRVKFDVAGGNFVINGYYQTKRYRGIARNGSSSLESDNGSVVSFGANAKIEYYRTGDQLVYPTTISDFDLLGTGIKKTINNITINDNLTIGTGVTLNDNNKIVTVKGNLVQDGTHTGTGKVTLGGGSAQHNISGTGSLNNLQLNDANGAVMSSDMTIGGTLTLTNGSFEVGNNTLTLNNPIAGTATNLILTNQSSLIFQGMANADIPSNCTEMNDLYVDVTGNLTLNSDVTVNGNLTLQNGNLVIGSHKLTVKGDIIYNTGAFAVTTNSDIEIGGSTASLTLPNLTFNSLTVNNPNGISWGGGTISDLNITNGTLAITADVNIKGDWNSSGSFTHNNHVVNFVGTAAQSISGNNTFYDLIINNTNGTAYVDASGSVLTVQNLFDLQDGKFRSATSYADVTIAASTTFALAGDITVSGTWTNNGGTFTHNNHKVTFNGTAAQQITGSATTEFYDFETNNTSGGIAITREQRIAHTLTFTSGRIFLGANNLILTSSATAIAGSPSAVSMVVIDGTGVLTKYFNSGISNYVFPVGDNTGAAEYSPAKLTIQGSNGGAYASVAVFDAQHPNDNSAQDFVSRYWTVDVPTLISNNKNWDFTFTYVPIDENGTAANIKGARWDGANWTRYNTVGGNQFQMNSGNISDWKPSATFAAIDSDAPSVVSITPSIPTVTDSESGGDNFSLDIVFDEPMNTSVNPTITFPSEDPVTGGELSFASGAWSNGDKTYTATYTVTDTDADIANIDVRVLNNGEDAAGNQQAANYTENNQFSIKFSDPTVTSVTRSVATIDDGTAVFSITVNYSEAMDPASTPIISFPNAGENPIPTITTTTTNWPTTTRFVQNYSVTDNDLTVPDIDIQIASGADTYGNVQVQKDELDLFNIDMENATITDITPSVLIINDPSGASFKLTLTFSKDMKTAGADPTVSFPTGGENPAATFGAVSYNWLNAQTCEVIYVVSDVNEKIDDIDVRVTLAEDPNDNVMDQYDEANVFSIDTENPSVTAIVLSADPITDATGASLTITLSFDEDMDETSTPAIGFPNESPFSTLTEGTGSWTNSTTYVRNYTITDANQVIPDVDIEITAAKDLAGNTQVTDTRVDYFDIDMNNATVTAVAVNLATITDSDVGATTFTITVDYSEAMTADGSANPTITFPVESPGATLTEATPGSWTDADTYVASYNVADANLNVSFIDIQIDDAEDLVGNTQTSKTEIDKFHIDMANPTLSPLQVISNNANNTALAMPGDVITITFTSSEPLSAMPVVTVDGNAAVETSLGGNNYKAEYTFAGGETEGVTAFNVSFSDASGNNSTATQADVTDASSVTFDETPPNSNLLASNITQYGGSSVSITASDDVDNKIWFAVTGKTAENQFTANSTMTQAANGFSVTILAPADLGTYYIYAIDEAGNVSARSNRALTVDNTPLLDNIEAAATAYAEGAAPVQITNTITIDDDSDVINKAYITISANYESSEDVLAFTNTATITGAWNATTGVLTLTGNDTKAAYETALRAVTFENTSEQTTVSVRTVSFQVYDGFVNSNSITRDINVTETNDNPAITSTPTGTGREDELYTYVISASDIDDLGTSLRFFDDAIPAWLILTDNLDGTALLQGTPVDPFVVTNDIAIRVTDGRGGTYTQNFQIIISASIQVDAGGGADYLTIQEGIDAAIADDKVYVHNGTYNETINFNGKDIELIGNPSHPELVIIDGGASGSVVTFNNAETATTVFNGFTIQNGSGTSINLGTYSKHSPNGYYGGGIYCFAASPTLQNLIVKNNSVGFINNNGGSGAGIYIGNGANPILKDSKVNNNTANTYRGGGICIDKSTLTIQNVDLVDNNGGNYGGGLAIYDSNVTIEMNSTIETNQAIGENGRGGGIFMISSTITLNNVNISGNTSNEGNSGITKYNTTITGTFTGGDSIIAP